jgi:hypothetical protein
MAAYLAEHVPHLQSLHLLLGLPSSALASDQNTIETAIRNAVTSLIRNRELEVDEWRDKIDDARRNLMGVARSLGEKGRGIMNVTRRESAENGEVGLGCGGQADEKPLPSQYEKLIVQKEELENVCHPYSRYLYTWLTDVLQEYHERLSRTQSRCPLNG